MHIEVLPGIAVWDCDMSFDQGVWREEWNSKGFELLFCRHGAIELRFKDDSQVIVGEKDLLLITDRSELLSARFAKERFQGLMIFVDEELSEAVLSQLSALYATAGLNTKWIFNMAAREKGCILFRHRAWVERLFAAINEFSVRPDRTYLSLKVVELIFLLCMEAQGGLRNGENAYFDHYLMEKVKQAKDYMIEHIDEKITISALSQQFRVSSTLLKRCFRYIYHKPIHTYMIDYRLERAACQLLTTKISSIEIAASVGYTSVNRFGEAFKKKYGVTPAKYRKPRD